MATLGTFIRDWRLNQLKVGTREFCLTHDIRSDRWRVIESDLAKPASFEKLAEVLAIKENTEPYNELRLLYFQHEPRTLTAQEMNGMMPAIHRFSEGQWNRLHMTLQNQMRDAIAGLHNL